MRQATTPAVKSLPRIQIEQDIQNSYQITNNSFNVSPHPLPNCTQNFLNYNIFQPYYTDNNTDTIRNDNLQDNDIQKHNTIYNNRSFRHRINIQRNSQYKKRKMTRSLCMFTNNVLDQSKYITNLSSTELTKHQSKVLSLGLGFIPTRRLDTDNLKNAVTRFERSNRIKHYFKDQPDTLQHPFRKKSTWIPPKASITIENYLENIKTTVDNMVPRTIFPNLTQAERRALNELSTNEHLVIKSADKGSGIVVEDRDKYIQAGIAHLSDNTIYEKIDSDPTLPLGKAINDFVSKMHKKGIIDNTTKEFLLFPPNQPPRTQQLYLL